MTVIVFVGPTLSQADVEQTLQADVRPPAARGDVLKACAEQPTVIALVDGYFDRVPAVWHKEILNAMAQGIHVFGAGSMGALRAAELEAYGMEGFGEVFASFRGDSLTDDDEVAVAHGSAEHGYRSHSDAMVNIRATLRAAQSEGLICGSVRAQLEAIAKGLHYSDRLFSNVLELALQREIAPVTVTALRSWLPSGRVDQKRADALGMLREIRHRLEQGLDRKKVSYTPAHTDAWDVLHTELTSSATTEAAASEWLDRLLDELCVTGEFGSVWSAALTRAMASEVASRVHWGCDAAVLNVTTDEFRRERGLLQPDTFFSWLSEQQLPTDEAVDQFFAREANLRRVQRLVQRRAEQSLVDELRARSMLATVSARATSKAQWLSRHGLLGNEAGISDADLWQWFEGRLGRSVSSHGSIDGLHRDLASLRSAVLREYMFVRFGGPPETAE